MLPNLSLQETRTVTEEDEYRSIHGRNIVMLSHGPIAWGFNRETDIASSQPREIKQLGSSKGTCSKNLKDEYTDSK